jgi:zinc finger HIT domain-containing protein 1
MPRRKAWDDAMQASGHAPLKQKSKRAKSGRQVVLSKAMKVVDDETRRQVRNARLEKLESDNYTEDLDEAGAEEEYRDEEEVTLTSTSSRSKVAGGKGRKPAKKGLRHKFKYTSFNQLVLDTVSS